jgi:hypothetical protein
MSGYTKSSGYYEYDDSLSSAYDYAYAYYYGYDYGDVYIFQASDYVGS